MTVKTVNQLKTKLVGLKGNISECVITFKKVEMCSVFANQETRTL